MGHMPPRGVKLSCMAFTEPLEAAVVAAAHRPRRLRRDAVPCPPGSEVRGPAWVRRGWGRVRPGWSARRIRRTGMVRAARTAQTLPPVADHHPKVWHRAAGISRMASIERKFDQRVGVFQGMGGVDVVEASAVGAELLVASLGRPRDRERWSGRTRRPHPSPGGSMARP
jgi:hypothetical protein